MKYLAVLFILSATFAAKAQTSSTSASKEVRKYLDKFLDIIKNNALYSDSINWIELETKVTSLSAGMNKIDECKPVIDTIMRTLWKAGDNHSFFLTKNETKVTRSNTYEAKESEGRYLENGIAYVKIPPIASMNNSVGESFANRVQTQIKNLDQSQSITGWVVDLRHNTGGSMYPMFVGISPLIKDETFGYIIGPKNQKEMPLIVKNGRFGPIKVDAPYKIKNQSSRIAVLIDSMTGSSGEFTAIAFKGLPNVRFFGYPSGGATTSNNTYVLSDGSMLLLSAAYMADRNKQKYLPKIFPDVIISSANVDTNVDATLEAAKHWLQEK